MSEGTNGVLWVPCFVPKPLRTFGRHALGVPMLRGLYDWTLSLAARKSAEWWLAFIAFVESSVFLVPADVLYLPMALSRPVSNYTPGPGKTTGLSWPSAETAETPKNQSSMTTPFRVSVVAAVSRIWVHWGSMVRRHQMR